LMDSLMKYLP